MENLVTVGQGMLETVKDVKLAVQAKVVTEGIQSRGDLRHRVCLLLRTTAWIIPQEGLFMPDGGKAPLVSDSNLSLPGKLLLKSLWSMSEASSDREAGRRQACNAPI